MLKAIALFEFKARFSRISTWVYFFLFLTIALFWIAAAGGMFKEAFVTFGSSKIFVNSPYALTTTVSALGFFGVLIMATVMGRSVQQDFEARLQPFFFTTPINKFQYLGGRFVGGFLVLLAIFSSIGIGSFLATLLPGLDELRLGPNRIAAYLWPYLLILLPNALLIGSIFFSIATLTRKMQPVYIGGVILLIGYLIAGQLGSNIDNKTLAAMVDPFGTFALERVTEYWTISERNTRLIPFEGVLLWNRVLWLAIAIACVVFCYCRFSFDKFAVERVSKKTKRQAELEAADALSDAAHKHRLIISPDSPSGLLMLPRMVWINFFESVSNVYFGVLVLAGMLFMIFASTTMGNIFGTSTWPVTYQVIELVTGSFGLFMIIIITLYAGEMVWRERDNRTDQIMDAMPSPTWLPITAKLIALMMIPFLLQIFLILCGVALQVFKGYYYFELGLYIKTLLGLRLVKYCLLCVLAIFIHSVVNQKYLGHFLMIAFYIISASLGIMGFEHHLYDYGATLNMPYSDMNGFGQYLYRTFTFMAYWSVFALVLTVVAYLFWTRGMPVGWRDRMRVVRTRLNARVAGILALLGVVFAGLGGYIFYNTNILNRYETAKTLETRRADYEKQYKSTSADPQPRITDVKLNVEIFPKEQRVRMRGTYRLVNKNAVPVEGVQLGFRSAYELVVDKLVFNVPTQLSESNEDAGVQRYKFVTPLASNAETTLTFDLTLPTKGFKNARPNTSVVENGTFINGMQVLPMIGYQPDFELSTDKDRRKYDLKPKERKLDRDDPEGVRSNDVTNFADWINFEATVSTDEDQIAIAPGYLQREWKADGRRHFEFKMDTPILNFFAFQSARYEIKKDIWKGPNGDVPIEIYHHPGHTFNLERMIASVKHSLTYNTKAFGDYQHKQFRIVEFPRYASFAQAFPNTIPYSEGVGFIAKVSEDDEKDIDYPYYITSHEAAHQWWGHQVVGANVQGASFLAESLSQYSALMVMKEKYGAAKMQKFLAYELDRYLIGRAIEQKKEVPLGRVEDQNYIHYNKGSLVMYALQDYIGEEKLNQAIKKFRDEPAFKGPPYPTATLLIKRIREVTPAHLQYVIDDMLESIVLYDNRASAATYKQLANGKYEVTLKFTVKKVKADDLGKETDLPIADWIDVGLLDEKGVPFFLEKRKIDKEDNEIVIMVDKKPAKAGIDPLNKLIDRRPRDNTISVDKV
jgi:ABC-2 type transport system permease protein